MTPTHQTASKTLVLALLALIPIAHTQPVSLHPRSPSPRIIPGHSNDLSDLLASISLKDFDTAPWDMDDGQGHNDNGSGKEAQPQPDHSDEPYATPSATPSYAPSASSSRPVVSQSPISTSTPLSVSPSPSPPPSPCEHARISPSPSPSPSDSANTPAPTPAKTGPEPEYELDDGDDDDEMFNSLLDVLSGRIRNVLDSSDELTLWD